MGAEFRKKKTLKLQNQNPHLPYMCRNSITIKSRERSSEAIMSVINGSQILFLEKTPAVIIYKSGPELLPI